MKNEEISDPLFLEAVEAIDEGNLHALRMIVEKNPYLLREPLHYPPEGYFQNPYLLWFIADNPIRIDKLPENIVDITKMLIDQVRRLAPETYEHQVNYALGLVATGRIPKESGSQIALIDLLIDSGARPGGGKGAIAHGNLDAARHLIKRGGQLSLTVAVGLDLEEDVKRLLEGADDEEKLIALTAACFFGKTNFISFLLRQGISPNGYPLRSSGFHSHATPLHQAVYSGCLDGVKLLVEAGANLDAKDKIYDGTPIGWAEYMRNNEAQNENEKRKFEEIREYLKSVKHF